jgi:hypothetical protein
MRTLRPVWGFFTFVGLLFLVGCGESQTGQVSGTVKVDGVPVKEGTIRFMPVSRKGQPAGGAIKEGQYSVQVGVGAHKVAVSVPKVVGKKKIYDTPNSPEMPITKEALPEKYNENTTLDFEVKPGKNDKDWDLKTK